MISWSLRSTVRRVQSRRVAISVVESPSIFHRAMERARDRRPVELAEQIFKLIRDLQRELRRWLLTEEGFHVEDGPIRLAALDGSRGESDRCTCGP
jgi:hypothetical protein